MNAKLALGWSQVSLRAKLTALSVAIIGVLLIISSLGTVALLRTYLQANVDNVLNQTAQTMRLEDPALIQARFAAKQIDLPALPTDYYMAYLGPDGSFLLSISQSTNPKAPVPNLSTMSITSVRLTHGVPFEIDNRGRPVIDLNEGKVGAFWPFPSPRVQAPL